MKKITLSILLLLISLLGYSRFSEKLDSETNGLIPSNCSTNHIYWKAVAESSAIDDFYVGTVRSTEVSPWFSWGSFISPVGNDQCATPFSIPVNTTDQCIQVRNATFSGSTVSAEGGTSCGTYNSADIWFQFTAVGTAQIIDLLNFKGTPYPIALTLYSGQCGSLSQLYCSLNNSITATNLTIGATYLIRASINSATTDRNVQFDVCVKTPQPPANGSSLNCLINTVNSDFEFPIITTTPTFPNDNTMLGWRTTASDHIIEVWKAPNYENVPAYSGSQFIELNAYQASGVFQDYSTPVTTVFNYGFAHRGRQGSDVCGLYAGPPGGPYTLIYTATTGKTAWSYNTGSYTVPTGQTVTRFIFQAISSSSGNPTIGNFLDSINFTANNSIITPSPLNMECGTHSTNVLAAGQGIWSAHSDNPAATAIGDPALNATTISGFTASGIYKYDWTTLYCTSTLEINYKNKGDKAPVFTQIQPVCPSTSIPSLPTISNDGITGSWSPALNNAITTTYTFTPAEDQCATITTMTIIVNPNETSTFAQIKAICSGEPLSALPTASIEGITGTWSPALNNTSTTTYTFTPDVNICAKPATMTITVNPTVILNFAQIAAICSGDPLSALPTTSNEGIAGTWTPPINNTATTSYTFTPSTGSCMTKATMTISVNERPIADFNYPNSAYCKSDVDNPLPIMIGLPGTFSSTPSGLSINIETGEINIIESNPGTYTVTNSVITNNVCPISISTASITILAPEIKVEEGCSGNAYQLVASPDNGSFSSSTSTFEWTAIDGSEFIETDKKNTIILTHKGTYKVKATTAEGCTLEKFVTVTNTICTIPKGISPGSGTKNSTFDLSTLNVKRLEIFNRYGTEVYSLDNYTNQWYGQTNSGEELPDGTYFYQGHFVDNKVTTGWVYINRKQS